MQKIATTLAALVLLSACAASPDDVGTGAANLDESTPDASAAATPVLNDGQIVPRKMKFRLGAGEVQEATAAPFLEVSAANAASAGVSSRVLSFQALSKVGTSESLPALAMQLTADAWSARAIACDADSALAFVVVQPDHTKLGSISQPVEGGPITKRACVVTVEQATSWEAWKQSQGPAAVATFDRLNPGSSVARTVLRAHFEADVGPRTSAETTMHVSGAFDLWDDRAAF